MKKLYVLLPAMFCIALLVFGGWWLHGKFRTTRDTIRTSHEAADSTVRMPAIPPEDSLTYINESI